MTRLEAVTALGLVNYDFAIPRSFYDEVLGFDHDWAGVWCYDKAEGCSHLMGYPRPLTTEARDALIKYNAAHGTHYRTEWEVL